MENNKFIIGDEEIVNEGWKVTDDASADWAIKKIADETAEANRLIALADVQIAALNEKKEKLAQDLENKTSFLKYSLKEYFSTVEHKQTKTQETYKLLSGTLVEKKASQKLVKNDDALVELLKEKELREFIKTEEKPIWGEFKKVLSIVDGQILNTQTGEILETEAILVEEVPAEFNVKF